MSCSATTEMSSGTDSPWLRTAAIAPTAATALAATSAVGRGVSCSSPAAAVAPPTSLNEDSAMYPSGMSSPASAIALM